MAQPDPRQLRPRTKKRLTEAPEKETVLVQLERAKKKKKTAKRDESKQQPPPPVVDEHNEEEESIEDVTSSVVLSEDDFQSDQNRELQKQISEQTDRWNRAFIANDLKVIEEGYVERLIFYVGHRQNLGSDVYRVKLSWFPSADPHDRHKGSHKLECTCMDFEVRKKLCKHIYYVLRTRCNVKNLQTKGSIDPQLMERGFVARAPWAFFEEGRNAVCAQSVESAAQRALDRGRLLDRATRQRKHK